MNWEDVKADTKETARDVTNKSKEAWRTPATTCAMRSAMRATRCGAGPAMLTRTWARIARSTIGRSRLGNP